MRTCCAIMCIALATSAWGAEVPFEARPVVAAGVELPDSLVPADLDGDGDLDLLLASGDTGTISWYENALTTGGFETQRVISSSAGAVRSLLAADLDADGDLDVVSASPDDDEIAWYQNTDGAGNFGSQQLISTAGDMPVSIFTADLSGDGGLDVLSASALDQEVVWYENTDGAGSFGPQRLISTADGSVLAVSAADVDGDGDQDVLVASSDHGELVWYPNLDGAGSFGSRQLVAAGAGSSSLVSAADLDGDGDHDVLSASALDNEIAWHRNLDGAGSFGSRQLIDGDVPGVRSAAIADVDGDGDLDVLSASQLDAEIAWYENTDGAGAFASQRIISATALAATVVAAADVDGDGDADALSASHGADRLVWYENRTIHRSAAFAAPITIDADADRVRSVFAADVDGDGDPDVLSASNDSYEIAWYENSDGSGSFGSQQLVSADTRLPAAVFAADVDGDADTDVLFASEYDDSIWWCRNLDGEGTFGPQQRISIPIVGWPRSVSAADLDGDGDLDALGASPGDDGVWWYENLDGAGSFGPKQLITSLADSPNAAFAADLDGDGDLDVLSASGLDDEVAWYENVDGAGSFGAQQIISTTADFAYSVFAADVDGDGDVDVLSASQADDKIAWYQNLDGAGSFGSQRVISTSAASAHAVVARDLDGDGDLDVLSASPGDDKIAWYENLDGAGSFGSQRVISTSAAEARSVFAADLDGDGDVDVLSGSFGGDSIEWYPNGGGQLALIATKIAPAAILEGETAGLLQIETIHRGRPGDGSAELMLIELLLEGADDQPLPSAAANALIDALYLYRDDGSGLFEPGADTLLVAQSPLSLVAGVQTLLLPAGHPATEVVHGTPVRFFLVVTLSSDAQAQTPNHFRLTQLMESDGIARDRSYGLPLTLERVSEALSITVLAATPTSDADLDGILDLHETNTGVYVSTTDTGTDPLDQDSDDDGFSDAEEIAAGSDPNDGGDIPPQPAPALGWWPRALMILTVLILLQQLLRRRGRRGILGREGQDGA